MKLLPLQKRRDKKWYVVGYTKVDDEDYEFFRQWHWHQDGSGYVARHTQAFGEYLHIRLHNILKPIRAKLCVDHINRDKLDNRKINLRYALPKHNLANKGKQKTYHGGVKMGSEFKGVSWSLASKKWRAYASIRGKQFHLGLYENEQEAARAYDEKAKELYGEFAKLNFAKINNKND